jgi:hypothetical protein
MAQPNNIAATAYILVCGRRLHTIGIILCLGVFAATICKKGFLNALIHPRIS